NPALDPLGPPTHTRRAPSRRRPHALRRIHRTRSPSRRLRVAVVRSRDVARSRLLAAGFALVVRWRLTAPGRGRFRARAFRGPPNRATSATSWEAADAARWAS